MFGTSVNDIMLGHSGNDNLIGKDGRDFLTGGTGADKLIGGEGDDSIYHSECGVGETGCFINVGRLPDGNKDTIDCGPGNDVAIINTSEDHDKAVNCEKVIAG